MMDRIAKRRTGALFWRGAVPVVTLLALFFLWQRQGVVSSWTSGSHDENDNDTVDLTNHFPSIEDTLEMATLSVLVYAFRHETNESSVCDTVNAQNVSESMLEASPAMHEYLLDRGDDIYCHWYHHDQTQGTQVMLVSSVRMNYVAVVYAGTDDLKTALTDTNVMTKPFGDVNETTLPDDKDIANRVRIHAGFNNAVFTPGVYDEVVRRVQQLVPLTGGTMRKKKKKHPRLMTTGHSLGAANAVLTAIGLTLEYEKEQSPRPVLSLNFGCPMIGNSYWPSFLNNHPSVASTGIWRFVLGWDLVPRLPQFFSHAGHTVQWNRNSHNSHNATVAAYYRHAGDADMGLAGVPFGWGAKPYIWVPGALWSHHMTKYWDFVHNYMLSLQDDEAWLTHFVSVDETPDNDDDGPYIHVDDDTWVNPPDDDAAAAYWTTDETAEAAVA